MRATCSTCSFWAGGGHDFGECRRRSDWRGRRNDDWCGEHMVVASSAERHLDSLTDDGRAGLEEIAARSVALGCEYLAHYIEPFGREIKGQDLSDVEYDRYVLVCVARRLVAVTSAAVAVDGMTDHIDTHGDGDVHKRLREALVAAGLRAAEREEGEDD